MSFFIGMGVIVAVILLLLAAPAIMRMIPAGGIAGGSWKTVGYALGGIAGMGVVIALMSSSTLVWQVWLGIFGLVAAAILLRGNFWGKVAGGAVVIFLLGYAAFHGMYGEEAAEVARVQQKEIAEAAKSATKPTPQAPASAEKGTGSDGGGTAGDAAKKGGDATTKDTPPKKTDTAARWSDQKAGEEIPVGKWSEETYVAPGCSLWFSIGDGDKVQYRYLNNTWLDYEPGSSPNATHIRHWVTKGGTTSRPYQLTCK
jgi:hypothetical protein